MEAIYRVGITVSVAALLMTFYVASSEAQELHGNDSVFFNGNDAYSWCQNNRIMALGYTAGLSDEAADSTFVIDITRDPKKYEAPNTGVALARKLIRNYCVPKAVQLDQITDVLCNYLRDEPQVRNRPVPFIFNDAMHKAWPCP